jgi:hypothetical protein
MKESRFAIGTQVIVFDWHFSSLNNYLFHIPIELTVEHYFNYVKGYNKRDKLLKQKSRFEPDYRLFTYRVIDVKSQDGTYYYLLEQSDNPTFRYCQVVVEQSKIAKK